MRMVCLRAVLSVGLCIFALLLYKVVDANAPVPPANDLPAFSAYWKARVDTVGPRIAYEQFKQTYLRDGGNDTHTAAHVMGDILYRAVGLKALDICDDSFSNGCYHQVIADELLQEGPVQLAPIEAACSGISTSTASACYHGAGHGLAEYYGQDLATALSVCQSIGVLSSTHQCEAGVFMQYNEPLVGIEGAPPASFDADHPYAPCDAGIPEQFLGACYFSLPGRLIDAGISLPDAIALCGGAPPDYRNYCYRGIGVQVPGSVLYDQEKTVALCDTLPTEEGKFLCRQEAAATLRSFSKSADVVDPTSTLPVVPG